MKPESAKLTIRLPKAHIEAAREYARVHGITLTELVDRQLRNLDHGGGHLSEAIQEISGLLPKDLDARAAYDAYRPCAHPRGVAQPPELKPGVNSGQA